MGHTQPLHSEPLDGPVPCRDGVLEAGADQIRADVFDDVELKHNNKLYGEPTVQFSNLADFYVYLTLILLSKINLYHRFKLWSRSARFSDDLQI